jgi:hypothetical protein
MLRYCTECLYPETKFDLTFNDNGVCSACTAYKQCAEIDWDARRERFVKLRDEARENLAPYDCIVPVSGGKDSTWQVLKCLEHEFRVLAVNARTDDLTPIGRRNLDNIARLGVGFIEVAVNPKVRARIARYALQEIGDCSWPEHVTFTVPVRVAVEKQVPVICWGEMASLVVAGAHEPYNFTVAYPCHGVCSRGASLSVGRASEIRLDKKQVIGRDTSKGAP